MAIPSFDTLHPEAAIALALNDSGIRREMVAYIASKLRSDGYASPIMQTGLPEAIGRLKDEFPVCWPREDELQAAKPGTFEAFRMRKELEAHTAKRLGRA